MQQNTLVACSHVKAMFNIVTSTIKYQNTSFFMVSIPMASQAVQKASLLNFPKLDSRIKRCAAHETKVNQCCDAGVICKKPTQGNCITLLTSITVILSLYISYQWQYQTMFQMLNWLKLDIVPNFPN